MEVSSSVVEIVRPARIIPPETIPPDTFGFTTEHSSSTYTHERQRRSKKPADNALRRWQTMSAVSDQMKANLNKLAACQLEHTATLPCPESTKAGDQLKAVRIPSRWWFPVEFKKFTK